MKPRKKPKETPRETARRLFAQHAQEETHTRLRMSILELVSHMIETSNLTSKQQQALKAIRPQTVNLIYQHGKAISGKLGNAVGIPISGNALKSICRNTLKEIELALKNKRLRADKRKWLTKLKDALDPEIHKIQIIPDEKEVLMPTGLMEEMIENALLCHMDLMQLILGRKFDNYYRTLSDAIQEFAIKPHK